MFTLKLYEGTHRVRIVEAESVTIYNYSSGASQVTVHAAAGDAAFYVGSPDGICESGWGHIKDELWYDRAFVENASGKTTESILPVFQSKTLRGTPVSAAA